MGYHLDGRVSAVLGTHTHVTTADERLLPRGTAFQCDVGMSGPHSGVIGRDVKRVLKTVLTFEPTSFVVAEGEVEIHATVVETDEQTHLAVGIQRVVLRPT
jgi:calcineurin-like phosphoesterase